MKKYLLAAALALGAVTPAFAWEAPCDETGCLFVLKNHVPGTAGAFIITGATVSADALSPYPLNIGPGWSGTFKVPQTAPCWRTFAVKFSNLPTYTVDPTPVNFCAIKEIDVSRIGFNTFVFTTK